MSLPDSLILAFFDKALIGALILIVGFWLNRYLERFRSQKALENEMSKLRNQKTLDILGAQLSQFYWPIYIRLQMDNAVWERVLERNAEDELKRRIAHEIEEGFILPNHEAICRVIESCFHLAQWDEEGFRATLRYLRHVAVYRAIRAAKCYDKDPIYFEEPWPVEFFPAVEKRTLALQTQYDRLLHSAGTTPGRLNAYRTQE